MPPVGKSGPRIGPASGLYRSWRSALGLVMRTIRASTTSRRLCGGMFVAIPTAMPLEPFTSRFGKLRRKNQGLFHRPVEVVHPLDRVLLDVLEDFFRDLREAALRVPHCGGLVLRAAPVALALHERIPEREILDHPRKRIVDC